MRSHLSKLQPCLGLRWLRREREWDLSIWTRHFCWPISCCNFLVHDADGVWRGCSAKTWCSLSYGCGSSAARLRNCAPIQMPLTGSPWSVWRSPQPFRHWVSERRSCGGGPPCGTRKGWIRWSSNLTRGEKRLHWREAHHPHSCNSLSSQVQHLHPRRRRHPHHRHPTYSTGSFWSDC